MCFVLWWILDPLICTLIFGYLVLILDEQIILNYFISLPRALISFNEILKNNVLTIWFSDSIFCLFAQEWNHAHKPWSHSSFLSARLQKDTWWRQKVSKPTRSCSEKVQWMKVEIFQLQKFRALVIVNRNHALTGVQMRGEVKSSRSDISWWHEISCMSLKKKLF